MTPLEMIAEWRRGCSVAMHGHNPPEYCEECTKALIEAIERALKEGSPAIDYYAAPVPIEVTGDKEVFVNPLIP